MYNIIECGNESYKDTAGGVSNKDNEYTPVDYSTHTMGARRGKRRIHY